MLNVYRFLKQDPLPLHGNGEESGSEGQSIARPNGHPHSTAQFYAVVINTPRDVLERKLF